MPLVRSFWLSTKPGKKAWIEPRTDRTGRAVHFEVKTGNGTAPQGTVNRQGARCIVCDTPVPFDHIRSEGKARRLGQQLMAIVAEGQRGRLYLPPVPEQEIVANQAKPGWGPETNLPDQALGFRVQGYGLTKHSDLFTARQLLTLATLSELAGAAREQTRRDAAQQGMTDDNVPLAACGIGAMAYADAVITYLAFALDKLADWSSAICSWIPAIQGMTHTFARNAIPMVWDFAEINPLSNSVGNWLNHVEWVADGLAGLVATASSGAARQHDATVYAGVTSP
jgi:putative DNA methylase